MKPFTLNIDIFIIILEYIRYKLKVPMREYQSIRTIKTQTSFKEALTFCKGVVTVGYFNKI